jgi:hypothetical protein
VPGGRLATARLVEVLAVTIVLWSCTGATARFLWRLATARAQAFVCYKRAIAKGVLAARDCLAAAHLVRTVPIDESPLEQAGLLVLLVLGRTLLHDPLALER